MADLSKLSNEDLIALHAGNYKGVSDEGLKSLSSSSPTTPPKPDQFAQFDAARGIAPMQPEADPKGMSTALARGGMQGASLGFGDEATGAAQSLMSNGDKVKAYIQARDKERADNATAQSAHPWAYGAGQVAGTLVSPLAAVGKGIAGASALGGLIGLGNSNADLTQGDVAGAAKDTAVGAAIGAGSAGLAKGLGSIGGNAIEDASEAAPSAAPTGMSTVPKGLARMSSDVNDAGQVEGTAEKLLAGKPSASPEAQSSTNAVSDFIKNNNKWGIAGGVVGGAAGKAAGHMLGIPYAGTIGTAVGGIAGKAAGGTIERAATATPDIIKSLTENGGERFVGAIKNAMQGGQGAVAATVFILQQTEPDFNKAMAGAQ